MFVKNTGLTLLLFMTTLAGIAQNAPFQMMLSPADSAREAGDLKKALEEFKKTAAREPENANNLYNYACALAIMRQPDSSLFYLNKSVELEGLAKESWSVGSRNLDLLPDVMSKF